MGRDGPASPEQSVLSSPPAIIRIGFSRRSGVFYPTGSWRCSHAKRSAVWRLPSCFISFAVIEMIKSARMLLLIIANALSAHGEWDARFGNPVTYPGGVRSVISFGDKLIIG